SILSIQIVSHARQTGLHLTSRDLFQHQTITELATITTTLPTNNTNHTPITGPTPLTPIQHRFFETHPINPHHYTHSVLLELTDELDEEALQRALDALLVHHDALRMRFERVDGQWRQHNAPVGSVEELQRFLLSDADEQEQPAVMEKIADDVHGSFDLG